MICSGSYLAEGMRDKYEEYQKHTQWSFVFPIWFTGLRSILDERFCLSLTQRTLAQTNTETIMAMDKTAAGLKDLDSTL